MKFRLKCSNCGAYFGAQNKSRKYCSNECMTTVKNKAAREKRRKNSDEVRAKRRVDKIAVEDMAFFRNPAINVTAENIEKAASEKKDFISDVNVGAMSFRVIDKSLRVTWFFNSKKKMDDFLRRNYPKVEARPQKVNDKIFKVVI